MRLCLVYDIISNNTSDNPLDLIDILKSFINLLEQKNSYLTFKSSDKSFNLYIKITDKTATFNFFFSFLEGIMNF